MKKLPFVITIFFYLNTYSQSVIITEIMADPSKVSDANGEWFEIWNSTLTPIDINGWSIRDSGTTDNHAINNGGPLIIQPSAFLILGRNNDNATNGGFTPDYTYSGFILANDTDEIILLDGSNNLVDEVQYIKASAGKSFSLDPAHFNSLDNDLKANWCYASTIYGMGDYGTPGSMNNTCSASVDENQFASLNIRYDSESSYLNLSSVKRDINWMLVNALGKSLLSGIRLPQSIPMSQFPPGIYILEIANSVHYKFLKY